jgi:hypothetical protein
MNIVVEIYGIVLVLLDLKRVDGLKQILACTNPWCVWLKEMRGLFKKDAFFTSTCLLPTDS